MFNHEQAHRELLEKIASLERMVAALAAVDGDRVVEIPRRDSVRRQEALARRARLQGLRQ
jgi:hypothetical protein